MNPYVEIIRAIPRPAISVMFAALIVQKASEGVTPEPWFLSLAIPIILSWFGQKIWERVKEKQNELWNI